MNRLRGISRVHGGEDVKQEESIAAVVEAGVDLGISIIDIGDAFAVLEAHILEGFRTVPPVVVGGVLKITSPMKASYLSDALG